ncbi:Ppx/GppA phosphatase family protein [Actinokineospora diospyrosa]|uniref:Exopolyphosphatase / guanosine-5'-triphosphate,3'-diphosphate pyrophosphatase n=1 Tax=Actinokineospora diospyrosa TaxID=103728 RepID=A0ABT1IGF7_9PSEU|nr:Ppx/GppA phosphatase family protein [Actinokineospora diospyrosa]MCP2271641.1 exopolyphosphatase / guanosine-5'-triphosphate,3'-diphosphate pyrophosphatase [Actinokineospora diospyrosa]
MSRVAAIDCGTNSIRLLVAEASTGHDGTTALRDLHREMRVVRLGQGVDATGVLAAEAIERTRAALVDYVGVLRRKGVERVRMVATSATRDAANRAEFFAMTAAVLGVEAEVISGAEEAELSFLGAVGELDPDDGPYLVADVGGGSTELVLGTWDGAEARFDGAKSVDVGCVRLTERALLSDPPTPAEVAEAQAVAERVLDEAFAQVPVAKARTWVGVAGTVTTLAAIHLGLSEYDPDRIHLSRIPFDGIESITARLLTTGHRERAAIGAMHPGRVDVIGGGAVVVRALARRVALETEITSLLVSEHDILDGIALSLAKVDDRR